jgi:Fibronectin type II domain
MEDGARLSSPDRDSQYSAIRNWLYFYGSYNEPSGGSSFFSWYWSGFRMLVQIGNQNKSVISPWYSNSSNALPISSYISNRIMIPNHGCTIQNNFFPLAGIDCIYTNQLDARALCEYRHCTTVSGAYCAFPFKVGGRLYDTCVPFGRADGSAWCATTVDLSGNMLTNGTCASTCPVSSCPVGFISLLQTCIHISAAHPYDTVESVQEAEHVCMSMGARLYQPRSIKSLQTLLLMNQLLFNISYSVPLVPSLLGYQSSKNSIALGISGYQDFALTYRDGSPFPYSLVNATGYGFTWKDGDPDENETNNCIVLENKQEFSNVPCSGYAIGVNEGDKLSYICEAKPFVTKDGLEPNKSCVFPFKANASDVWHHSCVYSTNSQVWSSYLYTDKTNPLHHSYMFAQF